MKHYQSAYSISSPMSNPPTTTGAHILVFPFPAQGHMLPLLDLTHQLSLRNLTITILVTPKNLPILTPLLSTHPQIQTLILPFPPSDLPTGTENVKDIGNRGITPIIIALTKLSNPIIQWFQSHPSPPTAILSDFFLGWTQSLASQLGIPRLAFYSSGAFVASAINYLFPNTETLDGVDPIPIPLPNSPSFPREHVLPSTNQSILHVKDDIIANVSSYGCIFNSFDALEGAYLDHMKTQFGHPRVWSVGPLALLNESNNTPNEPDGTVNVFTWLDGCPDGSVVYVCFGSQVTLNKQQMEALTIGLEKTQTRFILVVKSAMSEQNNDEYGVIPTGFEERAAGRGLVIKNWAPQVQILSHPSVGGFLTHCGWNSVLEAIVAAVAFICWPMQADQFVNAKLLVEYMGVGVVVCEGVDAVPDSDVLGKAISKLMDGEGGQKAKAMELREKALCAVKEGGSSIKGLDGLVKELRGLAVATSVAQKETA